MADVQTRSVAHNNTLQSGGPYQGGPRKRRLGRAIALLIVVVVLLVLVIAGTKFMQISKLIAQSKMPRPPVVVSAIKAQSSDWQPTISAVGSMKAVRGVVHENLSPEQGYEMYNDLKSKA